VRQHRRTAVWAFLLAAVTISFASMSSAARAMDSGSSGNIGRDRAAREAAEAPVRALLHEIFAAYNRGDVSGASAGFAPDGEMIAGDGTLVSSRAAIERFLSDLQARLPKGTQFVATVTNVRFAGPDVAVLTTEGGWRFPDETAVAAKNRGIQSVVAMRQSGMWRVVLFQRTRTIPAAPAPK
jgi:uncharacterized protein (TIGR02246 family)